jgi:hypothetical protein
VVNGTLLRQASSRTRSRTYGGLSGEPKCGAPFSVYRRSAVMVKHDISQLREIGEVPAQTDAVSA